MTRTSNLALRLALGVAVLGEVSAARAQANQPVTRPITLQECLLTALQQNHALQIQQLNPEIARATFSASRGYYDPIFAADVRRESSTDSGGFDPADFSRDAVYAAESVVAKLGLMGVLPTGMRYFAGGNYANSFGTRNYLNFDSYNLGASITVQQPLLKNFWIDQGRMTIQVNKRNLKITELGVTYVTMDVINQVQRAYYELLAARDHLKVMLGLLDMRETFLAGVQRQVEVGMMTPPDAQLAQSQRAATQALVIMASNLVTLAENDLKTHLGESFTNYAGVPLAPREQLIVMPETFDLSESWERGLRLRPDLAQLREDFQKANIDLKYRRNQLFPSLDIVAGYGRKGASVIQTNFFYDTTASLTDALDQMRHGDNPSDMIGVILTVPLGRTMERGTYRASRQLKAQADLLVKQREQLVMREISDALSTARTGWDQVQATREAVQFAKAALVAEERKLAGGKSSLFFVLQLQRDLATAQAAEVRAKANYNRAVSQLHFADASLLEAKQITMEYR